MNEKLIDLSKTKTYKETTISKMIEEILIFQERVGKNLHDQYTRSLALSIYSHLSILAYVLGDRWDDLPKFQDILTETITYIEETRK